MVSLAQFLDYHALLTTCTQRRPELLARPRARAFVYGYEYKTVLDEVAEAGSLSPTNLTGLWEVAQKDDEVALPAVLGYSARWQLPVPPGPSTEPESNDPPVLPVFPALRTPAGQNGDFLRMLERLTHEWQLSVALCRCACHMVGYGSSPRVLQAVFSRLTSRRHITTVEVDLLWQVAERGALLPSDSPTLAALHTYCTKYHLPIGTTSIAVAAAAVGLSAPSVIPIPLPIVSPPLPAAPPILLSSAIPSSVFAPVDDTDDHLVSFTCVVCMDARRAHLFQPCGHLCCCLTCSGLVPSCPMCQTPVAARLQVFLS